MTTRDTPITVAAGDGIGPEIMAATLYVLQEAGAAIEIHEVEVGEKVYLRGEPTGITPSTWEVIRHTKAFLKAPITTPQGGGFKSLNVTIRAALGLYANVRPCVSYYPFVATKYPGIDVVIIRENEEDLYMGIEYRTTPQTYEALKIMTRPGCERIIRYAFEYAQAHHRKKVTCFTKDNILKLSDGLFHRVFEEIGVEYPHLEKEHWIVDIGAAKLADTPTEFDVVVLPNLYGDILSDVVAQIAGSIGMAGSANIGTSGAMFEAIHGSAIRRAGQNLANPSGLLLAAVQMLIYIEQPEVATRIHNAWLKTIEDGVHTYDIYKDLLSMKKVGTDAFAHAVVDRLGQEPEQLPAVHYDQAPPVLHLHVDAAQKIVPPIRQEVIGVDVFIHLGDSLEELLDHLRLVESFHLDLKWISNRGAQVWPQIMPGIIYSDNWRCRYIKKNEDQALAPESILELLHLLIRRSLTITQVHYLFKFDEKEGFITYQ
jgi:isocitrate dehydrogenase